MRQQEEDKYMCLGDKTERGDAKQFVSVKLRILENTKQLEREKLSTENVQNLPFRN